ncbi:histone methylation protein DOT1-domain-containing protein [Tuber brumale]|nr:histone methylation protein DOT1-domain-containing protein [Tuber brumale]
MIANMGMREGGKGPSRIFRKTDQKLLSRGISTSDPDSINPKLTAFRYELVRLAEPDEFSPDLDILSTAEHVATYLLTPPESDKLLTGTLSGGSGGIVYNMRKAIRTEKAQDFLENLNKYNNLIAKYRRDGTIKANIARMKSLPFPLVEHILSQAYARTVAPEVESLKDYEAFTSNVYGELLPNFTTKLFRESGLGPGKVFVDLGSGTGNVVLHAALETGCEAYGCEIMKNATRLADRQKVEFTARCRMWGINPGKFRLEKGDFLESARIAEALKRADVVLVNNYVFDSELNQRLLNLFLDLKEGARILSLKPFVPTNHVITTRNAENPVSRLRVEEKEYFSGSVSWTDTGGKYYVQTVDGSMLREFLASDRSDRRRR